MNNKGFAITGILYTLFILFTTLTLTILSFLNYKKFILEKTVLGLENSFAMEEETNLIDSYDSSNRKANYKGKYVFETTYGTGIKCTIYLEKGEVIPSRVNEDFVLIPNDCNNLKNGADNFELVLNGSLVSDKLTLVKAIKLRNSD